jgi:2-polyprenyl-3-methyl-5-hydroxy-6-metoxy-1,4-benzoquinol methylase
MLITTSHQQQNVPPLPQNHFCSNPRYADSPRAEANGVPPFLKTTHHCKLLGIEVLLLHMHSVGIAYLLAQSVPDMQIVQIASPFQVALTPDAMNDVCSGKGKDMAKKVCPLWVGYLLASPVRRLFQNPKKILQPYLKSGMTAVDFGCAMGYFSLPIAEMVGRSGRVISVDLQEKMLRSLEKRAGKAKLQDRIETRSCSAERLGIDAFNGKVDFVLAFYVIHEVLNAASIFEDFFNALSPGGLVLVAEPRGHVSLADFDKTLDAGRKAGFVVEDRPKITRSHSALLKKLS